MVSRPQVLYCTAAEEESGAVSSRQETLYLSEESFCWTDLLILTSPLKPYGGPTTQVHCVASAAMTGLTLLAKSYSLCLRHCSWFWNIHAPYSNTDLAGLQAQSTWTCDLNWNELWAIGMYHCHPAVQLKITFQQSTNAFTFNVTNVLEAFFSLQNTLQLIFYYLFYS